jgi:hypothetical protein
MTYQPKHRLCVKPKHHQWHRQAGWYYRGVEVWVTVCKSCLTVGPGAPSVVR